MSIRCRMGLHRYRDLWRGDWNGVTQKVIWRCTRCDKQETLLLISPLSGPRRGPLFPDDAAVEQMAKWHGASH